MGRARCPPHLLGDYAERDKLAGNLRSVGRGFAKGFGAAANSLIRRALRKLS